MQYYYVPLKLPAIVCQVNEPEEVWPSKSKCEVAIINREPILTLVPKCFAEIGDKVLKDRQLINTVVFGTNSSNASLSDVSGNQFVMGTSRLG